MAVTETSDVTQGWDGNVPETHVTNEMASEPGFPARKQDGELVNIVAQRAEGTRKVLVDADGNEYLDEGTYGVLVPYEKVEEGDVEAETPAEVLQASVEASTESQTAATGGFDLTQADGTEVSAPEEEGTKPEPPDAA